MRAVVIPMALIKALDKLDREVRAGGIGDDDRIAADELLLVWRDIRDVIVVECHCLECIHNLAYKPGNL